jgi:hypothetical protein
MTPSRAWALLLLLSFSVLCSAQGTPVRSPEAVTALNACSAAMGSHGIVDIAIWGRILNDNSVDSEQNFVIKTKGTGRVRNEITVQGRTFTNTFNFGRGKRSRSDRPEPERIPATLASYYRPEAVPALACVIDVTRPNVAIEYVRLEQVNGRWAHHIRFTAKSNRPDKAAIVELISDYHLFIDAETFLVLQSQQRVFSPNGIENNSIWVSSFSDYRSVQGVLMPYHIERWADGQKHSEMVIEAIQVNAGISDAEFE